MRSIDPTTGAVLREVPEIGPDEARERAARAAAAQAAWERVPLEERLPPLRRAAERLRAGEDRLARLMAAEMGKPLAEGVAEVRKCAWVCEHYAEHAPAFLADEPVDSDASRSYVTYRPLGVVLAIMPWNFPFWQLFRFAAPSLAAGNGVLLKHAPCVPGCALAIEEVLSEVGLPDGLFRNLPLAQEHVAGLIADPSVAAVTLTGSTRAGRAVAAEAGAALKKVVLELGGSDPYVVLADADVPAAVEACAKGRLLNGGQSCIAAKRLIVEAPVYDDFRARLLERLRAVRVGPPLEEGTEVGPLAREDLRANLHRQVSASVAAGARATLGGTLPDGPGWFYPVTLLEDVGPGMPAWEEELFGPVAVLIRAADAEEALAIAAETEYGLGAAVFTRDVASGERIARERLVAGSAFVNAFVRSDPRLPFGGIRASGHGRELGREGILELVNRKTIWIA